MQQPQQRECLEQEMDDCVPLTANVQDFAELQQSGLTLYHVAIVLEVGYHGSYRVCVCVCVCAVLHVPASEHDHYNNLRRRHHTTTTRQCAFWGDRRHCRDTHNASPHTASILCGLEPEQTRSRRQ